METTERTNEVDMVQIRVSLPEWVRRKLRSEAALEDAALHDYAGRLLMRVVLGEVAVR